MAVVTMTARALHTLPLSLGISPCFIPRRCCCKLTRTSWQNTGVRGERSKATAGAESSSVSMDNFASVEELKSALLDSLEGAHLLQTIAYFSGTARSMALLLLLKVGNGMELEACRMEFVG